MTQETYRFAYDEANTELREIIGQFERLRARKDQVELVLAALRPIVTDAPATEASSTETAATEPAPYLVQPMSEVVVPEAIPALQEIAAEPKPEPVYASESSSDPFQRRIDNALKHGFGSKESRILPRALNGLLSRA